MVGYDSLTNELFELHVAIMGYYERPPAPSSTPGFRRNRASRFSWPTMRCWPASSAANSAEQAGSATIGSLLTRAPEAVPVVLSVKDLVSTHLAIIASTGAGKSYLASVVIEELMQPYNKACVLILDPHGEYSTLDEIANAPQFQRGRRWTW